METVGGLGRAWERYCPMDSPFLRLDDRDYPEILTDAALSRSWLAKGSTVSACERWLAG